MAVDNPIRILIVDDHPVVRAGFGAIVAGEADMVVAGEAGDGETAINLFFQLGPDVVLMNLGLPGIHGSDAMRKIYGVNPNARILAISGSSGEEHIHRALKAGAKGYLSKDAAPAEILSAIRAVCAGRPHIPPGVAQALARRSEYEALTPREIDVLEAIARGFTNKEIAAEMTVSESTIKARVKEILAKLAVPDRTSAVTAALRRGIIHL